MGLVEASLQPPSFNVPNLWICEQSPVTLSDKYPADLGRGQPCPGHFPSERGLQLPGRGNTRGRKPLVCGNPDFGAPMTVTPYDNLWPFFSEPASFIELRNQLRVDGASLMGARRSCSDVVKEMDEALAAFLPKVVTSVLSVFIGYCS